MNIKIANTPIQMLNVLKESNAELRGKCFDNCLLAVVSLHPSNKLSYILGFLTPPGHASVAHAWLQHDGEDGPIYLDPTLQDSSHLWNISKQDFIYDMRYKFNKEQLLQYLQAKYPNQELGTEGVPKGAILGPTLSDTGELL
ncbi:hypothetical protein NHH82_21420 [Oxalobacteraceae bacterium OTU3REALA1]|nr:hypothetical protein NHH82_21420 [Oxalobacteraceae bacterium OTU3REALA1]